MQTIARYNVSSVVFVFSMLSLDCILISDFLVSNIHMYSTSRYDSNLLGHTSLHQRCFCIRFSSTSNFIHNFVTTHQEKMENSADFLRHMVNNCTCSANNYGNMIVPIKCIKVNWKSFCCCGCLNSLINMMVTNYTFI